MALKDITQEMVNAVDIAPHWFEIMDELQGFRELGLNDAEIRLTLLLGLIYKLRDIEERLPEPR